jgi:hypothetical protein
MLADDIKITRENLADALDQAESDGNREVYIMLADADDLLYDALLAVPLPS